MKKIYSFINICLISIVSFLAYANLSLVVDITLSTLNLFIYSILPSLFFFMILSQLLCNSGIAYLISYFLQIITIPLFRLDGISGYVLISSAISGFPNNASTVSNLLQENIIDQKKANHLLSIANFPSPSFILASIGAIGLKNHHAALVILISCYLASVIIAITLRNTNQKQKWMSLKQCINLMHYQSVPLIKLVINSVTNTAKTIAYIASFIITFGIISSLFTHYFSNGLIKILILSLLEFSSGASYLATFPIDLAMKCSLITMVVCFSGLCVHMQIISIAKIDYTYYLTSRIIHAIIAGMICFTLLNFSFFSMIIAFLICFLVCFFLLHLSFYHTALATSD